MPELDDTVDMAPIGFSPWDNTLSSFSLELLPDAAARILDRQAYNRIQADSLAVLVEAFAIAAVIGPDEPVPYFLTEMGEAVPCPGPPPAA